MEIINNRYRVVKNLIQNRLLSSYLVFDMMNDHKLLQFNILNSEYLPESLLDFYTKEFIRIASIDNSHVIKNYSFGIISHINNKKPDSDQYYYTCEYIEEKIGLPEVIQSMDRESIIDIFMDICEAFNYLHLKGFVYGDLNLENIFLYQYEGRYKVVLNDIATIELERHDYSFENKQDLFFKAPRVLAGEKPNPHSDIYSLGALLLAMANKNANTVSTVEYEIGKLRTKVKASEVDEYFFSNIIRIIEKMINPDPEACYKYVFNLINDFNSTFNKDYSLCKREEVEKLNFHTKIVGREDEINTVINSYDSMLKYQFVKKLFVVHGESGSGKTRFLEEVVYRLGLKKANVYYSFSLNNLNENSNKSGIEILKKLLAECDQETLEKYEAELVKFVPEIGEKRNIVPSEPLSGDKEKYRLLNRVASFISDSVKNNPTVFVIDNMHLASEFTIGIFDYLYNEVARNRNIMIIFSYSDGEYSHNKPFTDFITRLRERNEAEYLNMKGLSYEQSAVMIQYILGMASTPYRIAARIYSQSYGNPLFINEIMKNLFSKKILFIGQDTGVWNSDYDEDYDELPMPVNMEQALLNQIKELNEEHVEILKIISIFSDSVSIEDISKFVRISESSIEKAVEEMISRGILCKKIGDRSFVFDFYNKILKNLVYDKMTDGEKTAKHRLAASILEIQYKLEFGINIEELIYHLEKAGEKDKIIKYFIENANRMETLKNRSDEINNLEKALSTFDENDLGMEKINLLIRVGDLYFDDGNLNKSIEYFKNVKRIALTSNNLKYATDAIIKIANVFVSKNDIKKVYKYLAKAEKILDDFNYKQGYLELKCIETQIKILQSELDVAYDNCLSCIDLCGEEYPSLKGNFYRFIGNVHMQKNNPDQALQCYQESIKCFEQVNDIKGMVTPLNNIGVIYGDFYQDDEKALEFFSQMRDLSQKNNILPSEILALTNIAETYFNRWDYETAYEYFKDALEKSIKIELEHYIFYAYSYLIKICVRRDDFLNAYNYFILAKKELENYPTHGRDLGEYFRSASELYYAFGDFNQAEEYIRKALKLYKYDDSILKWYSEAFLEEIQICVNKDSKSIDRIVKRIIEIGDNFTLLENRIRTLSSTSITLYDNGYNREAYDLFAQAKRSVFGPIAESINGMMMFLEGALSEDSSRIKLLLNALDIFKRAKIKNMIQKACVEIGDYYFGEEDFFYAANYYLEACEIIKDFIGQIPTEYKISFTNSKGFAKPFRKLHLIKKHYDNSGDSGEWFSNKYDVSSTQELEELINYDEFIGILDNEDFIKSTMDLNESLMPDGIYSVEDILANLNRDTIKSLDMIIKYLSGLTLATKGLVILDNSEHDFSVIASSSENRELPQIRHIFDKVRVSMEQIIISERYNDKNTEINILPHGVKSCICIPIMSKFSTQRNGNMVERRKGIIQTEDIHGYIYLESERILNNFNDSSLKKCCELMSLVDVLIEKHQLKLISSIDKLTGAYTRKYLEDALNDHIEKAGANGEVFSIIMFDLDHFKNVNDKFGHQTGDEVLRKVSEIVMDNIRRDDIFGRFGGEEFIIILRGTNLEDGALVAEELRNRIEDEKILGGKAPVTVSMGIAAYPEHGEWRQELIEKADQALYVAKETGRNKCQVWDSRFSNKTKGTNKLTGIIYGNSVQDSRNVLAMIDIIQLINKDMSRQEKIYSMLGRIIEIIEAQYGMLITVEGNEIQEVYGRKVFEENWTDEQLYNLDVVKSVIEKKQGIYMIDWDNVTDYDKITGIPDWHSIIVIPIVSLGKLKGILYLSASTKFKEFGFNEFNYVNTLGELAAAML